MFQGRPGPFFSANPAEAADVTTPRRRSSARRNTISVVSLAEWRTIALDRGDHGVRVDRVLLRHLRDEKRVSRNRIQKWIDAGHVLINGAPPPRAAWRVQSGDELRVRVGGIPARTRPAPESLQLDVLYEDDDLIAINKPAGLVVHPSYRNTTGTLMNGLLAVAQAWHGRECRRCERATRRRVECARPRAAAERR